MTKRLNQVVAIERDVKAASYKDLSKEHHLLQKPELTAGMSRVYSPKVDDGESFPSESKRVQITVAESLKEVAARLSPLFDLTFTKDVGNTSPAARGDVIVAGVVLVEKMPIPTLLMLEKQLIDLHTFVEKLPVLDPAENWTWDAAQQLYVTAPVETLKRNRDKKTIVMYPATDKHPAQTQLIDEEITVGTWRTVKLSGAIPSAERAELQLKVEALQHAVKEARERANMAEVEDKKMADAVFGFLFTQ